MTFHRSANSLRRTGRAVTKGVAGAKTISNDRSFGDTTNQGGDSDRPIPPSNSQVSDSLAVAMTPAARNHESLDMAICSGSVQCAGPSPCLATVIVFGSGCGCRSSTTHAKSRGGWFCGLFCARSVRPGSLAWSRASIASITSLRASADKTSAARSGALAGGRKGPRVKNDRRLARRS